MLLGQIFDNQTESYEKDVVHFDGTLYTYENQQDKNFGLHTYEKVYKYRCTWDNKKNNLLADEFPLRAE